MEMRNFFSQRVVYLWNSLPPTAVEVKSMGIFKTAIDRLLISTGTKGTDRGQENGVEGKNRSAMIK